MGYKDLSDEDKIEEAIKFVAMGQELPAELSGFLKENELYDYIMQPVESNVWVSSTQ